MVANLEYSNPSESDESSEEIAFRTKLLGFIEKYEYKRTESNRQLLIQIAALRQQLVSEASRLHLDMGREIAGAKAIISGRLLVPKS